MSTSGLDEYCSTCRKTRRDGRCRICKNHQMANRDRERRFSASSRPSPNSRQVQSSNRHARVEVKAGFDRDTGQPVTDVFVVDKAADGGHHVIIDGDGKTIKSPFKSNAERRAKR